jgi:hypothetical protein
MTYSSSNSLILREEHRLRDSEDRLLSRIFGHTRTGKGKWRKLA